MDPLVIGGIAVAAGAAVAWVFKKALGCKSASEPRHTAQEGDVPDVDDSGTFARHQQAVHERDLVRAAKERDKARAAKKRYLPLAAQERDPAPIVQTMITAFERAKSDPWRPTQDEEANDLIAENTMAFLIAAAIDRMGNAEALWRIPYLLAQRWGHLSPVKIAEMNAGDIADLPEIRGARTQASRGDLAKTIVSVARIVRDYCDGNPSVLFCGTFAAIQNRLQTIYGVGPGIARMMVILRMMYFGLEPEPGGELLPKLDVHVQRVFRRTGLVTECGDSEVRRALQDRTPRAVAIVDQAAWTIGRELCHPKNPECGKCVLDEVCPKIL